VTQLPLKLSPRDFFRLENFYFNQLELKHVIEDFCSIEHIEFLYLWGGNSTGKSHLLLAIAEYLQLDHKQVVYLPMKTLIDQPSSELLQALEKVDVVCIDDLDVISGSVQWQEGLFHCFNRLQNTQCKLLIAAKTNPNNLDIELADLRSRLATGVVYQLHSLNAEDSVNALIIQAQARGLEMTKEVAHYLLRYYSRDMAEQVALLQTLDNASMAAQRRLTIPFIKQVLDDV
jgi:DnaA-homolog protein